VSNIHNERGAKNNERAFVSFSVKMLVRKSENNQRIKTWAYFVSEGKRKKND